MTVCNKLLEDCPSFGQRIRFYFCFVFRLRDKENISWVEIKKGREHFVLLKGCSEGTGVGPGHSTSAQFFCRSSSVSLNLNRTRCYRPPIQLCTRVFAEISLGSFINFFLLRRWRKEIKTNLKLEGSNLAFSQWERSVSMRKADVCPRWGFILYCHGQEGFIFVLASMVLHSFSGNQSTLAGWWESTFLGPALSRLCSDVFGGVTPAACFPLSDSSDWNQENKIWHQ